MVVPKSYAESVMQLVNSRKGDPILIMVSVDFRTVTVRLKN